MSLRDTLEKLPPNFQVVLRYSKGGTVDYTDTAGEWLEVSNLEEYELVSEIRFESEPDDDPTDAFRIVQGRAILDRPDPEWLIDGIIVKGTVNMLWGKPWIGKSVVAVDIAGHIATGTQWADRDTKPGRVLYVMAEGVGDIHLRVRAWETHNNHPLDNLDYILEPVFLDSDSSGNPETDNYYPSDTERLRDAIANVGADYSLIIFDTLSQSMTGEENSNSDMAKIIRTSQDLCRTLPTTVLVIHHPDKQGKAARGASALHAGLVTSIEMRELGGNVRELRCDKIKYGQPFAPMQFKLTQIGITTDKEDPKTSVVMVPNEHMTLIGSSHAENDHETNRRRALCLTFVSHSPQRAGNLYNMVNAEHPCGRATFNRDLEALVKAGFITKGEHHRDPYNITPKGREELGSSHPQKP